MNKILSLLSVALFATPAFASQGNLEQHAELWRAIDDVATVSVNTMTCFEEEGVSGYYSRRNVHIVVCQDNAQRVGVAVEWTANDLDTLRHEAQHLIQDCIAGVAGDYQSELYLDIERSESALGENRVNLIRSVYSDFSEKTIQLEIEAFAVAENINAATIAEAVTKECKV